MTEQVNVRILALESILEIIENKKYSHLVENQVLEKYAYLDKRDRSFYTRLVEGTLERAITIDYVIDCFAKTKVKKQKPLIRTLLRMSVYQILYMDAIPDSAAINEAVKIAKKRGFSTLSGFVNGVLRNISRNKDSIQWPDDLSVKYSMPKWIVDLFIEERGKEKAEEILIAFSQEQKLSVRVNTKTTREALIQKLALDGIEATPIPDTDMGLWLSGFDSLATIEAFRDGEFYVQDASSMMVAQWANVRENDYCVDVCAAPGGKALHVAELLKESGHVDARDLTEYKVDLINENIRRTNAKNATAKVWDATVLDESVVEKADVVIADLPCSGLGVLGKKKDIRFNATADGVKELSALQQTILNTVCAYVKPGGTLMYSTCTITRDENEKNVETFLKEHSDFALDHMRQLYPGEIGNDGFFVARLIRKG